MLVTLYKMGGREIRANQVKGHFVHYAQRDQHGLIGRLCKGDGNRNGNDVARKHEWTYSPNQVRARVISESESNRVTGNRYDFFSVSGKCELYFMLLIQLSTYFMYYLIMKL